MLARDHIEKLLELNGVSLADSDDEIKSILLSAQWREDDVEAAMLVLRENKTSHKERVTSLHKVFRKDGHLAPEAVSSLLGIEMNLTSAEITAKHKRAQQAISPAQLIFVIGISMIVAIGCVYLAMWHLQVGIFHQTLL